MARETIRGEFQLRTKEKESRFLLAEAEVEIANPRILKGRSSVPGGYGCGFKTGRELPLV